jgi:hypothetical protein
VHNAPVRFPSPLQVVSLISALSLAALTSLSAASQGCNEASVRDAPDASPNCGAPLLEYPCHVLAAGTAGCSGDLDSGAALGRSVTLDGSFPANCTVIINSPVPDTDNQCSQIGTCNCNEYDGGVYGWICVE